MPLREMYVILVREKGLFLVEPVPGRPQGSVIEEALGLKGGYSTGLASFDLPDEITEVWVAWVEGTLPNGAPTFEYRAFEGTLSEEDVNQRLAAAGETPLKMHHTKIYGIT